MTVTPLTARAEPSTLNSTSSPLNLGSEFIASRPDERNVRNTEMDDQVLAAVHSHFKPEFLNGIDNIKVFRGLNRSHVQKIVGIHIRQRG